VLKRMLPRLKGFRLQFSPAVISLFPDGGSVERDWPWLVLEASKRRLILQNITTMHFIEVSSRDIRNFDEHAVPYQKLKLRSRLWITSIDAKLKPLAWRPTMQHAASKWLR
jgi:hypothetical protein